MRLKTGMVLLLLLPVGSVTAQQDVQFSQYVFNGLSVNPAYAGYKEDTYVNAAYRNQWAGFPGAPKSAYLAVDGIPNWAHNKSVGLGGQLLWDKTGAQEAIAVYGSYAYRIQLDKADKKRLCIGIGVGATQYTINGDQLPSVDPNDPFIPVGRVSTFKPDARVGVYYYAPSFYAGLSVTDLFAGSLYRQEFINSGNYQYANLQKTRHMYLTAGMAFTLSDNVVLKPSVMLKDDFHAPTAIDLNAFLLLGKLIWLGGSYRLNAMIWGSNNSQSYASHENAASAMAEFFATPRFRIGYSYDFALNGLSGYQNGSHEISLGWALPNKGKEAAVKYF